MHAHLLVSFRGAHSCYTLKIRTYKATVREFGTGQVIRTVRSLLYGPQGPDQNKQTFIHWQIWPLSFVREVLPLILTRKPPNLVFKNFGTFTNMVKSSVNFALTRKVMKFDVDAFNPSSTVLAITFSYDNETS
ncbi:hypothetical protein HanIR_Chr12g0582421 [Helianthus annuus]|nr:hypothetical protein HanIR_Chr12g0582421 [Helianthus annuus]